MVCAGEEKVGGLPVISEGCVSDSVWPPSTGAVRPSIFGSKFSREA